MKPTLPLTADVSYFQGTAFSAAELGLTANNTSLYTTASDPTTSPITTGLLVGAASADREQITAFTSNAYAVFPLFFVTEHTSFPRIPEPHAADFSKTPQLLRRALFFRADFLSPELDRNATQDQRPPLTNATRSLLVREALQSLLRIHPLEQEIGQAITTQGILPSMRNNYYLMAAHAFISAGLYTHASECWLHAIESVHQQSFQGQDNAYQLSAILAETERFFSIFGFRDPVGTRQFGALVTRLGLETLTGVA